MNERQNAYIRASAHFLCMEFPLYWEDLEESGELLKFISDNRAEDFSELEPEYVLEMIEVLAEDFIDFAKKY